MGTSLKYWQPRRHSDVNRTLEEIGAWRAGLGEIFLEVMDETAGEKRKLRSFLGSGREEPSCLLLRG